MQIFSLLEVGSFWFWSLIILFLISETVIIGKECLKAPNFLLVALLAFLEFGSVKPITYMWHHLPVFAAGLAVYSLIGVAWGRIKWRQKCKQSYKDAEQKIVEWLKKKCVEGSKVPDTLENEFTEEFNQWSSSRYCDPRIPIQIIDHKEWFIMTSMYWPFSFTWAITHDLFFNIFDVLYNYLYNVLQADADNIYSDLR